MASRPRQAEAEPTQSLGPSQYLTFYLTGEEYAVSILRIQEIVEYSPLTRVPTTPKWIRGVMNLRGSVVPVIDLAIKFDQTEVPITARTCIVIVEVELEGEQTVMGIIVDEVGQVIDLGADDVEDPPSFGVRIHVSYLLGMGKVNGSFVLLLDIDRVLSEEELLQAAATPRLVDTDEVTSQEPHGMGASSS